MKLPTSSPYPHHPSIYKRHMTMSLSPHSVLLGCENSLWHRSSDMKQFCDYMEWITSKRFRIWKEGVFRNQFSGV